MHIADFDSIGVGDELPPLTHPAVNRLMLALYAGASGDHNPIHVDLDFARKAGMPDVFAHGMLGMAWMGRLLTEWLPQSALRSFTTRFTGITQLQDVVTSRGRIVRKFEEAGENRLEIELSNSTHNGEVRITGTAVVAVPCMSVLR